MTVSRFPCRVCGQLTEGVDDYVVCFDCAAEFDRRSGDLLADDRQYRITPPPGSIQRPLIPRDVEARLRKLLDDW